MAESVAMRSGWDRLRYTLVFEAILIITVGWGMAAFLDEDSAETMGLVLVLSIKAMLINLVYNYAFDRFDAARGRLATQRSTAWRLIHALGFELTLTLTSLPILMWWLSLGWWQALTMDLVIMTFVVAFTYVYTLAYDRLFPLSLPASVG